MTLLLRPKKYVVTPRERGRWGVRKIVYLVPKYEKHTLDWWLDHIAKHWDGKT